MTEKEIEINKAFIKKGIDLALISAENPETGFISGQVCNQLDNQEMIEIATTLRSITQTIAKLFDKRIFLNSPIKKRLAPMQKPSQVVFLLWICSLIVLYLTIGPAIN